MGYEGVKIDSPHTYLPDLAAPAGPDSIYYRTGADRAPEAVRRYSLHYSIHHAYGLFVEYAPDFFIFKHLRAVDAGDVDVVPGDPETSFARCQARVGEIVAAGAVPLVCGGDHAITLPVVRAVAGAMSGRLGLIHLDSHYDLCWDPPLFAGSQWAQILQLPNVEVENFCQIGMRGLRQVPFEVEVAKSLGHGVWTLADIDRQRHRGGGRRRPGARQRRHRRRLCLAGHRRGGPGLLPGAEISRAGGADLEADHRRAAQHRPERRHQGL